MRTLAFLIALAAAMAFGQPVGSGVISGSVVQQSNGDPVRKASVVLLWQGQPRSSALAISDGAGRFSFDSLPAGKYQLMATRGGMRAAYGDSADGISAYFTLNDGEVRSGIVLRMVAPAAISGRVLDGSGDPLIRADVTLFGVMYTRGAPQLQRMGGTTTNDRGEYRFSNVRPGRYYLAAGANLWNHYQRFPGSGEADVFALQYFGDAADWRRSTPIAVRSGDQVRGIDIHVVRGAPVQIRGHVQGVAEIRPAAVTPLEIMVQLHPSNEAYLSGGMGLSVMENNQYHFEFPLSPPGDYELTATLRIGSKSYWASRTVDARTDPGEITLTLAPAVDITGRVRVEGPSGTESKPIRIRLEPHENGRVSVTAEAAADGKFTIGQVGPGVWDIRVEPVPEGGYIKSIAIGQRELTDGELTIGADKSDPLTIVLSARGATVSGRVEGDLAARRPVPIVIWQTGRPRSVAVTMSGADGKFEIKGLRPGRYELLASATATADLLNPETLKGLAKFCQVLDVAEGARVEASPQLITEAQLREVSP